VGKGIAAPSPQDTAADAVLKRLEHLKQVLHQPPAVAPMPGQPNSIAASQGEAPDAARLDQLLSNLKASSTSSDTDPQLEKLNGMLDKILQIQHPGDNAAGKDTVQSPGRAAAFELQKSIDHPVVPDIGSTAVNNPGEKAFYTLDEPSPRDTMQANTIHAIVEGDQTLVSGGTIGMRLSDDAVLNGVPIPKNTLLYGMVSLSGERMNVMVNSIRHNNAIYPVTLQVYDMDGLPGIRIPGAISREVAKESADQAVSGFGITTLDPSLGAQAAGAGIQAAKTLFSRKVKLVRVSVPTGYQVFLKNIKK
jgi:conjugative transposon TraM protein